MALPQSQLVDFPPRQVQSTILYLLGNGRKTKEKTMDFLLGTQLLDIW